MTNRIRGLTIVTNSLPIFSAPPNSGENQMQFLRFHPKLASLRLQFRTGPNRHAKEVLYLARLFLAGSNAFQKLFLRYRVVGLNIVCTYACSGADQLTNDSIRYRAVW